MKYSILFTSSLFALAMLLSGIQSASGKPSAKAKAAKKKFIELDKDKSGKIERQEFPGDDALFQRADKDGSGEIAFEEALDFIAEQEVEKIFVNFDKNRDGLISRNEVTEAKHLKNFDLIDVDANQKLSGQEVLEALRRSMRGETEGPKAKQVKTPPSWAQLLTRFDKNKDQVIAKDESDSELGRIFNKLDGNNDGLISATEYQSIRARYLVIQANVNRLKIIIETHRIQLDRELKDVNIDAAEKTLKTLNKALEEYLGSEATRREAH